MNSSFDPQYRVWFLAADNRDLVVSALSNHSVPAFVDEPDFGWVQVLPSAEGTTIIRDLS